MVIFNVLGERVRALVNDNLKSGLHTAIWDGKDAAGVDCASGMYLYRLSIDGLSDTKKLILLR